MKVFAKIKTKSKKQQVSKMESPAVLFGVHDKFDECLEIMVKELPVNNKANKAVIKLLSAYYKVPTSKILIISGQTSKFKVLKIDT